jgi:methionyl aminopeptidase
VTVRRAGFCLFLRRIQAIFIAMNGNNDLTYDEEMMGDASEFVIHKPEDFAGMRRAGKLAAEVLDYVTDFVQPGVTTEKLNQLCHDFIISHGAVPAPLNYKGFPKSICTSINHVVCHGIPEDRALIEGDIMNIDVTVILDGWYGDTSRMYGVGEKIAVKAKLLMDATYESLMQAIAVVKPGTHLGDIGHAIQSYVEPKRFSVVRDFCGHGIGRTFHTPPSVLHYGDKGRGPQLQAGMFFTIEPMINAGGWQTRVLNDGWTAVTRDKSLSAQFEHTLGVTDDGCEIFTLSPKGYTKPPYV